LGLPLAIDVFELAGDSVGGTAEEDVAGVLVFNADECSVAGVAGVDAFVSLAWLGVEDGGGVETWRPAVELEELPSTGSAKGVTGVGESVTGESTTQTSVRVAFPSMCGQGETPT
jgi:hypothetical protein